MIYEPTKYTPTYILLVCQLRPPPPTNSTLLCDLRPLPPPPHPSFPFPHPPCPPPTAPSCVICELNAAASDCSWACCGRCCVETYGYGCPRHTPPEEEEEEEEEETETETEEVPLPSSEENDETETEEDDESPTQELYKCDVCETNTAAVDCDFGCCGRCCRSESYDGRTPRICSRHNPEEEVVTASMNEDGSCRYCPNVAARNCENFCCGKCCFSTYQDSGVYCPRHNFI